MSERKGLPTDAGGFEPVRLNSLGDKAWAVVARRTGAIALDRDNRLIMRLTEDDARRIAAEMTAAQGGTAQD